MSIFYRTLEETYQRIDGLCLELKRDAKKFRYDMFMQSDEWRHIRGLRLDIAGHRCEQCGTTEDLQVHHLTYERFGGDENMQDLQALCKTCHERAHGRTF